MVLQGLSLRRFCLAIALGALAGCEGSRTILAINTAAQLYSQHRYEEALAKYDEAVRLTPSYGWGHLGRGNCLMELNRLSDAIAAYEEAVKLLPTEVEPALWLGIALDSAGRSSEAVTVLERAVALRVDDPKPQVQLGIALASQGDTARALQVFEDSLRRWPGCMASWPEAIHAYERAKQTAVPPGK
jgi:tetratricopeptide (TPR) repeat protein